MTTPMGAPESIAAVLGGILASVDAEADVAYRQLADHPAMQKAVAAVRERNYEDFSFGLLYPMEQIVDGLFSSTIPGQREAQFIFKHGQFIEAHLRRLITDYESRVCSHDKVRTIIGRLLHYYLTGKKIAFDWTAEYTYHYPKTIFTTHEAIIEFFESLYALYYGNPSKYLTALQNIMAAHATATVATRAVSRQLKTPRERGGNRDV